MILRPTVVETLNSQSDAIAGLQRQARYRTVPNRFPVISASGVAGPQKTSEMSSSRYRPFYPCTIDSVSIEINSPSTSPIKIDVNIDRERQFSFVLPAGATFALFELPQKYLLTQTKPISLSSIQIDEEEAQAVTIQFYGKSQKQMTQSMVLGFPEQEIAPVPTGRIGVVFDIVEQPNGKVLIGGDFTRAAGVDVNRITRLNANGTPDTSFDPGLGANGRVTKIQLMQSGKIYIGGDFTSFDGQPRNRLALLNDDGSLDLDFNPEVSALNGVSDFYAFENGRVLITGRRAFISGEYRNRRIFYLNTDGTIDFNDLLPNNYPFLYVSKLDRMPNNRFVFTWQHNGIWISKQLWPTDTLLDDFKVTGTTYGVISQASNGAILVSHSSIDGRGLEVVNSAVTNSQFYFDNSNIRETRQAIDNKYIMAGSLVVDDGNDIGSVVRLNSDFTLDTSFNSENTISKAGSTVFLTTTRRSILAVQPLSSGKVLVGGRFDVIDPADTFSRVNLVRLNADGTLDTSFAVI